MSRVGDNPFQEEIELQKSDQDLIRAYRAVNRSVDDLAYTPDFDRVYDLFVQAGNQAEKHEVFRRLLILRKSGLLPRLFRPVGTSQADLASRSA
jgi:hypothetical protein